MKKLLVILFSMFTLMATAASDDNEFVAFSLKGKANYKNNEKDKSWTEVKTKTQFFKGGIIKLEAGAELVLLHKQHKTIKLSSAGTYKIDKLMKDAEKQPKDEASAYLEFIWKEFNKHHESAESYHREYMQTKGGVDREGCKRPIMLTPAYGEKMFTKSMTLTWEKDSAATEYTVVFYQDEFSDEKLLELDVKGESLTISTQTFWLRPGKKYVWNVYPKGQPNCSRFTFNLVTDEEYGKVIAAAEADWNKSPQTPLDAIMAGSKLEDDGFMEAAGTYFYRAMELSGFAPEYKVIYSGWLSRAGRLAEARKWWV